MFRRIVSDFAASAVIARELSLGLYEAITFLAQGHSQIDDAFALHDASVRSELPNF